MAGLEGVVACVDGFSCDGLPKGIHDDCGDGYSDLVMLPWLHDLKGSMVTAVMATVTW